MKTLTPTPEQQVAINYHGSMVAIAKPGSGKTFVMSEKIRLVLPILPDHQGVIAISYTNKASDELKKRSIKNGINQKSSFFGTIDKFCDSELIFPFLPHLWGKPENDFVVSRIRDLDKEKQDQFSKIKENQVSLDELESCLDILQWYFQQGILLLETSGALALYTLTNSQACQKYIKSRYTHIFVDEYQDSGLEQHELFLKFKKIGLNTVAVGDADQSIFGFSNKDSKYLLALAKSSDFKSFPIIFNHRCHPSIINYSQRILSGDAELLPADEIRVFLKECIGDQRAIARWIDNCIPKIIQDYGIEKKSDIGILIRSTISGKIVNNSIKLKHRFFKNHSLEENFSLWAQLFCQLLKYHYDSSITAQEIIDSSPTILTNQEVRKIRKEISKIRSMNQKELFDIFSKIAFSLLPNSQSDEVQGLLKKSLGEDLSQYFAPAEDDEVQLMTIHKAKGLEFDIVFHLDLYEWAFPAKQPGPGNDFNNTIYSSLEQDFNLHYVGLTRAKKACFLCTSTKRIKNKWQSEELEIKNGTPSEFLTHKPLITLREVAQLSAIPAHSAKV